MLTESTIHEIVKRCHYIDTSDDYYHYDIPKNFFKDLGFNHLRAGGTRTVFGNKHFVIKIGGIKHNTEEFYTHKKISKHEFLKYSIIPMFKHIKIKKVMSLIIAARARKAAINKLFTNFKSEKFSKQKTNLYYLYHDTHVYNMMIFGDALVMVDFNFGTFSLEQDNINHWISSINFLKHKTKYDKLVNKLKISA